MPGGNWRIGTIGFSYPEWNSCFYPPGLAPTARLAHYASRFDSIELDTTFYALPRREIVRRWRTSTPSHFRFGLKAPSDVTHAETPDWETLREFLHLAAELEDRLGAILFQFPPDFGPSESDRLLTALDQARGFPVAVEFRHRSWWFPRWEETLARYGAAWVAADLAPAGHAAHAPGGGYRPLTLRDTADFRYVRWCGVHGQLDRDDRELWDCTPRLEWWLRELGASAKPTYGFFGNSYAGHAPASARRLERLLGVPGRSLFEEW